MILSKIKNNEEFCSSLMSLYPLQFVAFTPNELQHLKKYGFALAQLKLERREPKTDKQYRFLHNQERKSWAERFYCHLWDKFEEEIMRRFGDYRIQNYDIEGRIKEEGFEKICDIVCNDKKYEEMNSEERYDLLKEFY